MNIALILRWKYGADKVGFWQVVDYGQGQVIDQWDELVLGTQPTPQELE